MSTPIFPQPDVIAHVRIMVAQDEAAIVAQNARLQEQIDLNTRRLEEIAFFRKLADDLESGAAWGMIVLPGVPTPSLEFATPPTPGI